MSNRHGGHAGRRAVSARDADEIPARAGAGESGRRKQGGHRVSLTGPQLHDDVTPGLQQPHGVAYDRPVATEPVRAAVERQPGLVAADLRSQARDVAAADVRWIADDEI